MRLDARRRLWNAGLESFGLAPANSEKRDQKFEAVDYSLELQPSLRLRLRLAQLLFMPVAVESLSNAKSLNQNA